MKGYQHACLKVNGPNSSKLRFNIQVVSYCKNITHIHLGKNRHTQWGHKNIGSVRPWSLVRGLWWTLWKISPHLFWWHFLCVIQCGQMLGTKFEGAGAPPLKLQGHVLA